MKMSIGEKKILFVFGCPNREATVDRLYQVADLIPDPAGRKAVEVLAEKLDSEGVEKWYRCFFYNMKLEMEAYYRHKAIVVALIFAESRFGKPCLLGQLLQGQVLIHHSQIL